MDVIKDIAAIVGCILSCISLLALIVKPLRKKIVNFVARTANKSETTNALAEVKKQLSELHVKIDRSLENDQDLKGRLDKVEKNVLTNECDRIRTELSDCAARCRRNIRLFPEEFIHIQESYAKYHDTLKGNSTGTDNYLYIKKYFESQNFDVQ